VIGEAMGVLLSGGRLLESLSCEGKEKEMILYPMMRLKKEDECEEEV